eukprot:SAG31_NODE_1245_length_9134_cov_6.012064_2_plen_168_part_00
MKATPTYVLGKLNYQSDLVPCSLRTTGKVGITRLPSGKDSAPFGLDPRVVEAPIYNARNRELSLDQDGAVLLPHEWEHPDYFDEVEILDKVYPECAKLVKQATGCTEVMVFDHNVRASSIGGVLANAALSEQDDADLTVNRKQRRPTHIKGGNAIVPPAATGKRTIP